MDLEDDNFIYEEGWDYPRAGHFVNQARLDELSSFENRQGMPLIEKVGEVIEEELPIEEIPNEPEVVDEVNVEEIADEVIEIKEEKAEKPKRARKKK